MGYVSSTLPQVKHSRVSHSGMPHSGVAHLSREMSLIRLDVQKASCLKDVFHLAGRVEKVCQKAGEMEAEKVQLSTQAIFQKNGMQSVLDLGMSCFQRLEEIEKNGMTRDLSLLKELQQISSKAEDLDLQFVLLSPEQIAAEIEELTQTLKTLSQKESFNEELLDVIAKKALEKVRHLQFRLDFPLVEELCEFSYQNNFARNLKRIVQDLKNGSEKSFASLPLIQRKEILKGMKDGAKTSPSFKATKTLQYLRHLQMLAHLAENFLYGKAGKVIDRFARLDEKTKKAIENYLFSASGQLFEEWKSELKKGSESAASLCASAVMAFVSAQVVGAES